MSGIMLGVAGSNTVYETIITGLVIQYLISDYTSGSSLPDSSGNVRHGTIVGSPTHTTPYFTFDGTNDYYRTNDLYSIINGTENHTVETWIYPTGNGVVTSYIGQTTVNTDYHHTAIEIVSGNLEFGLWDDGLVSTGSTGSISLNAWHQVTLTYDGSTCRGYLDGALSGSATLDWVSPLDYITSTEFYVAVGALDSTNQGDGTYFDGRAGIMRYYNRALSLAEIQNNYNATLPTYSV